MNRKRELDPWAQVVQRAEQGFSRRSFLAGGTAAAAAALSPPVLAQSTLGRDLKTRFMRVPTQYIAALGDENATSGKNAQAWGLWRLDPGPRGVELSRYDRLKASGVAPAGWTFDGTEWWLEEHGLIMEPPEFPLPPGQYMVTGNRDVKSVLTVHAMGTGGTQGWELSEGATIYDVTHLRCRSALYTPVTSGSCSPAKAQQADFPVTPGAEMPPVEGCHKQDYAVLIVIGMAVESSEA